MIHLIKNYYAEPYTYGYVLVEDRGRKDKEGNPLYDSLGYCGTLEEILLLLKRKLIANKLKRGMYELDEVIAVIRETNEEIKEILGAVINE